VLYNKWRPSVFAHVCGQPHITKTLLAQLKAGRLAHAYLFTGSRGTGKTTCAKILARAANCELSKDGEPCNVCHSCLGILNGSATDFAEIDAASNSGVDNIRALREELVYSPVSCKKRVYIIDEVHMLSSGAFNALLKTLEEPPPHVLFILATTETHKVPATIVSRCQRFAFRRLPADTITEKLRQICADEGIQMNEDALRLLAQTADGSLRDAESLLEQCSDTADGCVTEDSVRQVLGLTGLDELAAWLGELGDLQKSMAHLERLYQAGMDVAAILGQLSSLLRDLLMGQMLGNLSITRLPSSEAEKLSVLWPRERILQALSQFTETRLSRSSSKKLEAELCLIRLACFDDAPVINAKTVEVKAIQKTERPKAPLPAVKSPAGALTDAADDPRWLKLLGTLENELVKNALEGSGAKIDGDRLIIETDDAFIQGVLKQAKTQISAYFPGGAETCPEKPQESTALDKLIETAGVPIIEE
jgi:DNA polymerase-3 subunit gamma/tau